MRIICTIIILFLFNSLSIAAEQKITTEEDVKRIYNSIVKIFSIVPLRLDYNSPYQLNTVIIYAIGWRNQNGIDQN